MQLATIICQAFDTMLAHWSTTKDQVHVLLRDNARNMIKTMEECGLASLGCMAHTLQLAVNEAVVSQRNITDVCLDQQADNRTLKTLPTRHLPSSKLAEQL